MAGVSPSTISRVCNDNPSIGKEAKEKVRQAMAELDHELPPPANAPADPGPRFIGVVLPPSSRSTYEDPFYLETLRGISRFRNQRRYISAVITGQDEGEVLQALQNMGRGGQMAGVILLYPTMGDRIVDRL